MLAKTKHMNIRVAENDYKKIKQFADFNGKSISALMLDAIWEQIEYQEDLADIAEYEKEKANGTLTTVSWQELKSGTGL
jgi:predicted transcriptional regulator